ncbi:MAG: hypothetical protein ACRDLT_07790 [Solirubrobacteraceae bacterium]
MPIPDKKDLRRFCELDGWEETEAVSPDHDRYRKKLDDGGILRTKVSHGRGPVCDDIALWTRIWRHQLGLESEDEFWEVLKTRKHAPRGQPTGEPTGEALDAWLFEFLVNVVGLSENEVLALSSEAAMELYLQQVGRQAG